MKNNKKKSFIIGIVISICLMAYYILIYNKEEKEITFQISDDIISFATRGDLLICLTSNGELIEYDRNGNEKVVNQAGIKYISEFGNFFLIKSDGSIVINIDDDYNGDIIGKISGAKSGCVWSDMILIVTDNGDLYFYSVNSENPFEFTNTEMVDGWMKIKDVSEVTKAYVLRNSGQEVIFTLNSQGEVFSISTNNFFINSFFHKISENKRIVDISAHGASLILLDNQGSLYQIGHDMISSDFDFISTINKIDNLIDVKKISTSYYQGAALTRQGEVYVWLKEGFGKGKGWYYRTKFEKLLDGDWEDIIISNYLYVIKGSLVKKIDFESLLSK